VARRGAARQSEGRGKPQGFPVRLHQHGMVAHGAA